MRFSGTAAAVSLSVALQLSIAMPALAEHARNVPAGLTATLSTANFKLHYNPSTVPGEAGMTIAQYAQAGAADFEEAYSRLVAGGGGSPNAGLRVPVNDSDGLTDVYLGAPTNRPSLVGGLVRVDSDAPYAAYAFMTPGLSRGAFRFRAGHELMHVVQNAYCSFCGETYFEAASNWAADFSLPDIDPLDNDFGRFEGGPAPWLPIDCLGTWDGRSCAVGYGHWLFLQSLTEEYGADLIADYYERTALLPCASIACGIPSLNDEIADQSGGAHDVRSRYAIYARDIWDPTRWQTAAVGKIHLEDGTPVATEITAATPDLGSRLIDIDHLGTRYLRIINDGGFEATGPDDRIRITLDRPAQLSEDVYTLFRIVGQEQLAEALAIDQTGHQSVEVPADPATVRELIVPLSNDTLSGDNLPFGYRVEFVHGTPTPPPNDLRAGAIPIPVRGHATTDSLYAGGRGSSEAPGCTDPAIADATRGVWFTFRAAGAGLVAIDALDSETQPVIAVYEQGSDVPVRCGRYGAASFRGPGARTYEIYVGREGGWISERRIVRVTAHRRQPSDFTPPQTRVTAGPRGATRVRAPVFRFASSERGSRFLCAVDRAPLRPCRSPRRLRRLPFGPHTFKVVAIDRSGNRDRTPAVRRFRVVRPPS